MLLHSGSQCLKKSQTFQIGLALLTKVPQNCFLKVFYIKLVKDRVDFSYLKVQCAVGFCGGKAGTSVKCHQKKRLVVTTALLLQRTTYTISRVLPRYFPKRPSRHVL